MVDLPYLCSYLIFKKIIFGKFSEGMTKQFSCLQVLIRLFGVEEHMYANYMEAMRWIEDSDVLEMIVSKFSSSVSGIL